MNAAAAAPAPAPTMNAGAVHSVWHDNFDAESAQLRAVAPLATHVALSVQYPGCAVAQAGTGGRRKYGHLTAEERYDMVKTNVDELQPIQLGLAIRTGGDDGELVVFEFNLRGFDVNNPADLRDPASIEHLRGRGVDIDRLPHAGVEPHRLRSLLLDSGLLQARPSWATFTGAYHVGYLMKILTGGAKLPAGLDAFTEMVIANLGEGVYDVKRLAAEVNTAPYGFSLMEIAACLGVVPAAVAAQGVVAGAGAVSTLQCFEALRDRLGEGRVEMHRHQLCGLRAY